MKTLNFLTAIFIVAGLFTQQFAAAQAKKEKVKPVIDEASYNTAIGLRAGQTSGLTIKHFFNEQNAFEGIVGVWPYAFGFTGLYEKHKTAFEMEGMKWYYGGGGHATFGTNRTYYVYRNGERYYYRYNSGDTGLGIDGILGLEYKIKAIPFAISLDMKPYMEINNAGTAYLSIDGGLGIKVAF